MHVFEVPVRPLSLATSSSEHIVESAAPPWAWVKCIRALCDAKRPQPTGSGTLPVAVNRWLYLSDEKGVRDVGRIAALGVTHVLSTNRMPRQQRDALSASLSAAGIAHHAVSADDDER